MLEAKLTIDASQRLGKVDRNLYGHFIEHLGRCINDGIWGEMLQARKFAGADRKGNGLPDPWEPLAGRDPWLLASVAQTEAGSGVPCLRLRILRDDDRIHGVVHPGLTLRAGTTYSLRVWARSEGELREAEVSLGGSRVRRAAPGESWEHWELGLPARWDADDAALLIGACGRGELWLHAPSLMPTTTRDGGGFRPEVTELVQAIDPPLVRWPGGCFADSYQWRDGIGERDSRPVVFDTAWNQYEPNDFGTDEFVAWCRLVGAEPYICVNTGSAGAEDAAAWVQYCNGSADSEWGARRAEAVHPEPHSVKYWGIGNETYGGWEIGNIAADEYGRLFLDFAEKMRAEDPTIELIAVGADPVSHPDWNRTVLEVVGDRMDYLAMHRYVPHTRMDDQRERQYAAIVAAPADIEARLRMVRETIDEVLGADNQVKIAFDEWNVWLDAGGADAIAEVYELRDAICAAGVFNALHRLAASVAMANLAQLVNVLPAILTSPTGAWGTPQYYAFKLYTRCLPVVVGCKCASPTFDTEEVGNIPALSDVPYLDASATMSQQGDRLALAVVNRHMTDDIRAEITLAGLGTVHSARVAVLSGESERSAGTEQFPDAVSISEAEIEITGDAFEYTFPAHSAAVITGHVG